MMTNYDTCIRVDHEDGQEFEVPIEQAYEAIQSCYDGHPDSQQAVRNELHDGHPVRTTFATYRIVRA